MKEDARRREQAAREIERALNGRQVELYCKLVDDIDGNYGRKTLPAARISDTVAELKAHIERAVSLSAKDQILIINGRILSEDNKAIADYLSLASGKTVIVSTEGKEFKVQHIQ